MTRHSRRSVSAFQGNLVLLSMKSARYGDGSKDAEEGFCPDRSLGRETENKKYNQEKVTGNFLFQHLPTSFTSDSSPIKLAITSQSAPEGLFAVESRTISSLRSKSSSYGLILGYKELRNDFEQVLYSGYGRCERL